MKNIKTTLFVLLILLLNTTFILSQSSFDCYSEDTGEPVPQLSEPENIRSQWVCIRIYFHIIRKSDHTGGMTLSERNEALQILKTDYAPYKISFYNGGTEYLDSDTYYYGNIANVSGQGASLFTPLTAIQSHSDGIDIYIGPKEGITGGAAPVPGKRMVVSGQKVFGGINTYYGVSHVLTHEMGHCLGLYHTFRGRLGETGTPEPINGQNCENTGDFVCDTPADGVIWRDISNLDCNRTSPESVTDPITFITESFEAQPTIKLYMAYTYPQCMSIHTLAQVDRMRSFIRGSSVLTPVRTLNLNCNSDIWYELGDFGKLMLTNQKTDITVFPNPLEDILAFKVTTYLKNVQLSIIDITGKQVFQKDIDNIPKSEFQYLDVSFLQKGVYIFKLKYGDKESVSKFVKL